MYNIEKIKCKGLKREREREKNNPVTRNRIIE